MANKNQKKINKNLMRAEKLGIIYLRNKFIPVWPGCVGTMTLYLQIGIGIREILSSLASRGMN